MVIKPFRNLVNSNKGAISSTTTKKPKASIEEKSKPLIIFGTIISITSIFLLLFTINNKFG